MNHLTHLVLLACFGLVTGLPAQGPVPKPQFSKPAPMEADRAMESYSIYSVLLKQGPIGWRTVNRRQWLIEDTTSSTPLGSPCRPQKSDPFGMNPHDSVKAPEERRSEWDEVLSDFDQRCHDVLQLERRSFRMDLPVHMMSTADKLTFKSSLNHLPAEFADGAGLHSFSQVYFNSTHMVALVEQSMWCGEMCGYWTWVVLERKDDGWRMLPWVVTSAVS